MNNIDVQLFWANDEKGNIAIIYDLNEEDRKNKYTCPVCGSDVKPVAIGGKTKDGKVAQKSSHFSHFDASKCNNETAIHWWFKNKILIDGDNFIVKTDVKNEFKCKEVLIEQSYETEYGIYKPDITIITECGNTIYFEMNYTNKKKVEDYIDKWLVLGNIVVEVDLKTLMEASYNKNKYEFKALFYEGKCFNQKKNDTYYNTIGKYKEKVLKKECNEKIKENIRKLNWLWKDIIKYKNNEKEISEIAELIFSIDDNLAKDVVIDVLRKPKCNNIIKDYIEYKIINIKNIINKYYNVYKEIGLILEYDLNVPNKVYDRIYKGINVFVYYNKNTEIYDDIVEYGKESELIEKIESFYINRIIYTTGKGLLGEINQLFNFNVNHITKTNNLTFDIKESYYKDEIYLRINDTNYLIDLDIDINNINENLVREKIYDLLDSYLINPFSKEIISKLDKLTSEINLMFNLENSNFRWLVESCVSYNTFEILLKLDAFDKTKTFYKLILRNNKIFFDNLVNEECININELDSNYLKNVIIEKFNSIIQSKLPISDNILNSIKLLQEKYKDYKNLRIHYEIISPIKVKIIIYSYEDSYVLYIENNNLYKNNFVICLLEEKTSDEIIQIISKIINSSIYIDVIEILEDKLKEIIYNLNNRFSQINGNWRVGYFNNDDSTIITLLDKNNISVDKVVINDIIDNLEKLQNDIIIKFSNYIRSIKYKV